MPTGKYVSVLIAHDGDLGEYSWRCGGKVLREKGWGD